MSTPASPLLSPSQLETLVAIGEERSAPIGELLYRVGDRGCRRLRGRRDRRNGRPLPGLFGLDTNRRQLFSQLPGHVHPQPVGKQDKATRGNFDGLGSLGKRLPILVDEFLQVAGGVFESLDPQRRDDLRRAISRMTNWTVCSISEGAVP